MAEKATIIWQYQVSALAQKSLGVLIVTELNHISSKANSSIVPWESHRDCRHFCGSLWPLKGPLVPTSPSRHGGSISVPSAATGDPFSCLNIRAVNLNISLGGKASSQLVLQAGLSEDPSASHTCFFMPLSSKRDQKGTGNPLAALFMLVTSDTAGHGLWFHRDQTLTPSHWVFSRTSSQLGNGIKSSHNKNMSTVRGPGKSPHYSNTLNWSLLGSRPGKLRRRRSTSYNPTWKATALWFSRGFQVRLPVLLLVSEGSWLTSLPWLLAQQKEKRCQERFSCLLAYPIVVISEEAERNWEAGDYRITSLRGFSVLDIQGG